MCFVFLVVSLVVIPSILQPELTLPCHYKVSDMLRIESAGVLYVI